MSLVINFFDILRDFIKKSDLLTMVTPLKRVKNRRVKQERYPISINNNFYSELFVLNDLHKFDELINIYTSLKDFHKL